MWVTDYLDFVKREKLFSTFLTRADYADGDDNRRWDTSRNAALSEIFGFYGLAYWYAEQVTILGPRADLDERQRRGQEEGGPAARRRWRDGLRPVRTGPRRRRVQHRHAAHPNEDGGFTANGTKYYIGNGNVAGMVSVFGRRTDIDGPEGYVFFVADSQRP